MHCRICGKKSDDSRICENCSYFLKKGVSEEVIKRMYSDDESKKIWKENEKKAEALAEAYYDSVIEQFDAGQVKKDSKKNFGYNTFMMGIKCGLDILLPMLDQETRELVEERIKKMVEIRKHLEEKEYSKNETKNQI